MILVAALVHPLAVMPRAAGGEGWAHENSLRDPRSSGALSVLQCKQLPVLCLAFVSITSHIFCFCALSTSSSAFPLPPFPRLMVQPDARCSSQSAPLVTQKGFSQSSSRLPCVFCDLLPSCLEGRLACLEFPDVRHGAKAIGLS